MAIPTVITYVYIRGKWYAFSDTNSAREAAVKYKGNLESLRTSKPVGVLVDERTFIRRPRSFWPNVLSDAPGVIGNALTNPQVNPIHRPVPVTPDPVPVVTPTVRQAPPGGGGGGGGGGSPPRQKEKVWNYDTYVEQNPDLSAAYEQYKLEQSPHKIDSWELHGKAMGTSDLGAPHYSGSTMTKNQFGEVHWNKYGVDEPTRKSKAFKMV
jgi:hypothetical protein